MFTIRRVSRILRWSALAILVVGPIAAAAIDVHARPDRIHVGFREVSAGDQRAADYLRERSPLVDRLLPDGRGGTHFFENLDDNAGMAFLGIAAIGLSVSADRGAWLESVELHERAHLVDAFLPAEVAALLVRLPAATRSEIAAEDAGQHFAEMAAKAWEVVAEPTGVCVDGTPADRLEDFEASVPGTAGFVARYLRIISSSSPESQSRDERAALLAMADRLSAPQRDQWDAIWRGVDARRRTDGTLEPWGHRGIRENLAARRLSLSLSDHWLDRIASVALWPSLAIVTIAERL